MPKLAPRSIFDPNDPDKFSVGALAGIIVGVICAALVVSLMFVGFARRRRAARKSSQDAGDGGFNGTNDGGDTAAQRSASLSAYVQARRANGSIAPVPANAVEMQRVTAGVPETREQRRERRRLERLERERAEVAAGIVPLYTATSGPREIKLEEPPKYEAAVQQAKARQDEEDLKKAVLTRNESSESSSAGESSSSGASEHRPGH